MTREYSKTIRSVLYQKGVPFVTQSPTYSLWTLFLSSRSLVKFTHRIVQMEGIFFVLGQNFKSMDRTKSSEPTKRKWGGWHQLRISEQNADRNSDESEKWQCACWEVEELSHRYKRSAHRHRVVVQNVPVSKWQTHSHSSHSVYDYYYYYYYYDNDDSDDEECKSHQRHDNQQPRDTHCHLALQIVCCTPTKGGGGGG
jgi:hypothetical protein